MHVFTILFTVIPGLSEAFSNGSLHKKISLLFQFLFFALTRKTFLRGKAKKFNFTYLGKSFCLHIESIVDLAALSEVFLLEEYSWVPFENPKVIIDLGAHFGDTALYYHFKYPDAHIYAVEPAPETYKRLCKNVANISQITPIQAGVSDKDGFAELHILASSLGNSFKKRPDMQSSISVPVYTLQTLLQMCNINRADIIKFDIEGAEEMLFINADPSVFADAYIGEVHGDLISVTAESFVSKFKDFNIEKEILSNSERFILKAIKKNND
jgi:FkbM family methyltransferase